MMIGYDIYDCFTMKHFRLRQRMTLTTKIYCSRLYIKRACSANPSACFHPIKNVYRYKNVLLLLSKVIKIACYSCQILTLFLIIASLIAIQGISRVIMSPTELKMQPTLHFRKKLAIEIKISSFFQKCIVSCIFNSVGFIITREIPHIINK
jgi:hypothetical protein